jgi:hypothetical protein
MLHVHSLLLKLRALLVVSVFALPLRAESNVRLSYRAVEGCPSQAEFVAAVSVRGGHFDQPPAQVSGSKVEVWIQKEPGGSAGFLGLRDIEGLSGVREVHAANCSEAMQGLAVIAALVLRQLDRSEPTHPPPEAPALEAPALKAPALEAKSSAPSPAVSPAVAAAPSSPVRQSNLRGIGQFATERVPVGAGTLTFDHAVSSTLSAGIAFNVIPSVVMPRYDLTLSRANFVTTPDGANYLLGRWLPRMRWTVLGPSRYEAPDFSSDMWALKAGFGGCTSLSYDTRGLVLLACSEFAAGFMHLETQDNTGAKTQSKTIGLGTVGLGFDAQYNLGELLHLALNIGGDLSASKISAERPDGSEIFHTTPFSGYATLGVGMHF